MNKLIMLGLIFTMSGSAYAVNPLDDEVDPSFPHASLGYDEEMSELFIPGYTPFSAVIGNVQSRKTFPHAALGYDEEMSELFIPGHSPHRAVAEVEFSRPILVDNSSTESVDYFLNPEG